MRTGVGSGSWKAPGGNSPAVSGEGPSALSGLGWCDVTIKRKEHLLPHHAQASGPYVIETLIANCPFPFIPGAGEKLDKTDSILLAVLLCGFQKFF